MAGLLDRGDSYRVDYLGSAMLMQAATGLGLIQKPLRELYFIYRQNPAAEGTLQERHLTMTHNGMTMSYRNKPGDRLQEEFFAVPSILFWDAVQFITVRSPDKKIRCAFEPLDNDHSRNKDNLFVVLEKKLYFLQQRTHPCLFACVLRRTTGLKALDVHAFVCRSDDEALGLVHALDAVQNSYTTEQVSETGVFGYNPFGKESVRSRAGLDKFSRGLAASHPQLSTVGLSESKATDKSDNKNASSHRPQDRVRVLPPGTVPTHRLVSPTESNGPAKHPPPTDARVHLLTQSDFIAGPGSSMSADRPAKYSDRGAAQRPAVAAAGDDHTYQYIPSIHPSLERPAVTGQRPATGQHEAAGGGGGGGKARAAGLAAQAQLRQYFEGRSGSQKTESSSTGGKKTRVVASSSSSALSSASSSKSQNDANIGQGYSLLSGSGGPIPGQLPPRHFFDDSSSEEPSPVAQQRRQGYGNDYSAGPDAGSARGRRSTSPTGYQRTLPRDVPPGSSASSVHGGPGSVHGMHPSSIHGGPGSSIHGGGPGSSIHGGGPVSRGPSFRELSPYHDFSDASGSSPTSSEYDMFKPRLKNTPNHSALMARRELPPTPNDQRPTRNTSHATTPTSTPTSETSSFSEYRPNVGGISGRDPPPGSRFSPSDHPNRPVAKVTPHKITGVKVLPTSPVAPDVARSPSVSSLEKPWNSAGKRQSSNDSSPDKDVKSSPYIAGGVPKRSQSQYFRGDSSIRDKANKYESNWQFKSSSSADSDLGSVGRNDSKNSKDSETSDKLLVTGKKDAEIASVLQDMNFNPTKTMASQGTNFERSLGYFP